MAFSRVSRRRFLNRSGWRLFCVALLVLATGAGIAFADPPEAGKEILLADFEKTLPAGFEALRAEAALKQPSDQAPVGQGFLHVTIPAERKKTSQLLFKLPKGADLSRYRALSAYLSTTPKGEPWKLRWQGLNEAGQQIFQRVFEFDCGSVWTRVEWPLALWRWSNSRVGDWSEVRSLVLNIENGDGRLQLDDIRLQPGRRGKLSALPRPKWIATVAFPGEFRSLDKDGFFLATDATEVISDEDLKELLAKVSPIRKWLRATFKKALRPVGGDAPVSLLIFSSQENYKSFYNRLGVAWRVSIGAPGAGGYTVQDVSSSTYSSKYGIDRPVYFHELVHAAVSRELRLLAGTKQHSWLHEGIANYLQLCLYPKSLGRDSFIRNFSKPVTDSSFFKPLRILLTNRPSGKNYAQLASLVAFLAAEQPDWFDRIALGISDGKEIGQVLRDIGTDFEKLQAKWLDWGKRVFAPDAKPPAGPGSHFPIPPQWRQ